MTLHMHMRSYNEEKKIRRKPAIERLLRRHI